MSHIAIFPAKISFCYTTGKDATEDFEEIGHSSTAKEMLDKYLIGNFAVSNLYYYKLFLNLQQHSIVI